MLHLQLIIIKYLLKTGSFTLDQILVHNILNSVLSIEKTDINLKDVTPSHTHTHTHWSIPLTVHYSRVPEMYVRGLIEQWGQSFSLSWQHPFLGSRCFIMHITKFSLIIFHRRNLPVGFNLGFRQFNLSNGKCYTLLCWILSGKSLELFKSKSLRPQVFLKIQN